MLLAEDHPPARDRARPARRGSAAPECAGRRGPVSGAAASAPRTRRPGGCPDCSPGSAPPRSRRYRPEGPVGAGPVVPPFPKGGTDPRLSRYPVARLKPVFAAATSIVWVFFRIMKSLLWRSVMWRPGTPALSFDSGKPKCCPTGHRRQEDRSEIFARRRPETPVGLRPPSVSGRRLPSHPDCRASLILIVAPHRGPARPPGRRHRRPCLARFPSWSRLMWRNRPPPRGRRTRPATEIAETKYPNRDISCSNGILSRLHSAVLYIRKRPPSAPSCHSGKLQKIAGPTALRRIPPPKRFNSHGLHLCSTLRARRCSQSANCLL